MFCVHWYCVLWMAIETKFSKLCISCNLDEYLYAHLNEWALWLLFVMSKIELSLILKRVSLFLTGRTKKSWEKNINNHLTTVARQSCMTFVCLGIAKLECQKSLGISFPSLTCPCMICLKKKYGKKNQKQKDQNCFKNNCKRVF